MVEQIPLKDKVLSSNLRRLTHTLLQSVAEWRQEELSVNNRYESSNPPRLTSYLIWPR